MCGIFGVFSGSNTPLTKPEVYQVVKNLFLLSESRGKEASGIAGVCNGHIELIKSAEPASQLIAHVDFERLMEQLLRQERVCAIGHSRLVTNGGQERHENNQPAVAADMVAIHNGIVTNVDDLWEEHPALKHETELDTEVLLRLIRQNMTVGVPPAASVQRAYAELEGVASLAILLADYDLAILASNNGSLYYASDAAGNLVFASERYFLQQLLSTSPLKQKLQDWPIQHLKAGTGLLINTQDLSHQSFMLDARVTPQPFPAPKADREIRDMSSNKSHFSGHIPGTGPYVLPSAFQDQYPANHEAVARLRRCTRCVLPETMPFITFDEQGVCNYCHSYEPIQLWGMDALLEALKPYRKGNGEPDCVVTFSGGRDSSYALHLVKNVLGMHPVTYTYDWGMVTDLARRNQMRLCGKLGLEHILVSADIARKRHNIRLNVLAWLKKPDLGMVPLFMAGDKQYFYYANKVGEQMGCKVVILGENLFEAARFKYGYCGIAPDASERTHLISLNKKFKLARYYGRQYFGNPGYLNASLIDTLGAYVSYYFIPHHYINIYQYLPWDEKEIITTLKREYNWETATDTEATWRIGDGTASFYNYIYYTLGGLTENDTFRSNQVREGVISRQQALALVEQDNQPRYESIQWYCDIIGIDFEQTIRMINAAPKLYAL